MRKATLSKLTKLIIIAQIVMAITASVANASTVCSVGEYYNASEGMIIKSEVCWDDSNEDHEVDDSLNHETILDKRLPVKGETGFKG